ncbi:hypothetical protein CDAR_4011 [Caerostris darwini]|uniref:Maturase K n=1 Tax=Caerostris darwini TaxID=1538125 RepID=A0AAV4SEI1_9ARAC|nr:hypothetical protein CDAR_3991 [Caerostris darwini]GIY30822.1 hypothetical protein CDAR_4011 [Caerostris darwini]
MRTTKNRSEMINRSAHHKSWCQYPYEFHTSDRERSLQFIKATGAATVLLNLLRELQRIAVVLMEFFHLSNYCLNLIGKLRHFLQTIWKHEFENGLHRDKIRSAVREERRHHNGALCKMIENQLFSILFAPLHCRNDLPFSQSVIRHNAERFPLGWGRGEQNRKTTLSSILKVASQNEINATEFLFIVAEVVNSSMYS